MSMILERCVLTKTGDPLATVAVVSLPVPQGQRADFRPDFPGVTRQPVAWWRRHHEARRHFCMMVADDGQKLPQTLGLTDQPLGKMSQGAVSAEAGSPGVLKAWTVEARIVKEQLEFVPRSYYGIASLRAVPYLETTHVEYEAVVRYNGHEVRLQAAATGSDGTSGPYAWQNVCVDDLGGTSNCQFFRVGGVIYNSDTYLWADVYLQLFSNGVANVYWHFVNTKLHIEGYDFQGLPVIRFIGNMTQSADIKLPSQGTALQDLGGLKLNFADASGMCSSEHPATLRFGTINGTCADGRPSTDNYAEYVPFSRTFNPQLPGAPELEWAPGMARTIRFQFSLGGAHPAVAKYSVPSWLYTEAGEPWVGRFLPVKAVGAQIAAGVIDQVHEWMKTGRFDVGNAGYGNDGFIGTGMVRNGQLRDDPDMVRQGLDYCYYWADLAIDHRDFSVHQWIGGWPWKTCAYSKHRDVLIGWMETADPYLLETFENAQEQYWMWFTTNWPRNSIGRDGFEITAWAWHWRFLDTERAKERMAELARMLAVVLTTRGVIGGQMGAGPHPGYHASLYMTGVTMVSLMEVIDAYLEKDQLSGKTNNPALERIIGLFPQLHKHFNRDDVELFPSNRVKGAVIKDQWKSVGWGNLALRVYPGLGRYLGWSGEGLDLGLHRAMHPEFAVGKARGKEGRPGDGLVNPLYHDALILGATIDGDGKGIRIEPIGKPERWLDEAILSTPLGELTVKRQGSDLLLSSAVKFPVTVIIAGREKFTDSQSRCSTGL